MATIDQEENVVWTRLLVEGETITDLWKAVRRLAPADVITLLPVALNNAADGLLSEPLECRRRLIITEIILHRTIFDLMGLERSPDADLLAPVPLRFFADGNDA